MYLPVMPNNRSATKKSAATAHDDNNEVSNDDFNTMMDKKLNEFKFSIISELIESTKVLIQSEFQNTIQKYKSQLNEASSTVAMLQQHMTNLKQENSNQNKLNRGFFFLFLQLSFIKIYFAINKFLKDI